MYFLRRRHGRKPAPEARREPEQPAAPGRFEEPERESHPMPIAPARPKVVTKARRQRVTAQEDDCKPAGTFRAGTLHLDHSAESQAGHGKL
jgi:hypothetical protein